MHDSIAVPSNLAVQSIGNETARLSWLNPCNKLVISFTYNVKASSVSSGKVIQNTVLAVLQGETPQVEVSYSGYACQEVNYSIALYGDEIACFTVEALPASK